MYEDRSTSEIAQYIAECIKWMTQCPVQDKGGGQALYETFQNALEETYEAVRAAAKREGKPEVIETIEAAINEGEFGELEEIDFWEAVAKMAE